MIKGVIIAIKSFKNQAFTGIISFSAGEKVIGIALPEVDGISALGQQLRDTDCLHNHTSRIPEKLRWNDLRH